MRRVRLEKLCETKNAQAERNGRRDGVEALARGRAGVLAGRFGFGGGAGISAVRSSTSFNPAGSIVHFTAVGTLFRPTRAPHH